MATGRLVHIVEDEAVLREHAASLLRSVGYDVELWPLGASFAQAAPALEPGCVLLDYRMPEMDGLDVLRVLAAKAISMPVIIMTGHGDVATAVACMKAGAVDFLEKPFGAATLLATLEKAFQQMQAPSTGAADAARLLDALSMREREVLQGLTQGFSNKMIARSLAISPRTVEIHRARLMMKLKVSSLSGALRIAFAADAAVRR